MLSIVIPTLNAAAGLPATLESVAEGVDDIGKAQIIIADGGSTDSTLDLARQAGTSIISSEKGRGNQLAAGADTACSDWLLFIHADTLVQPGGGAEVARFIEDCPTPGMSSKAAVFRFELDDASFKARVLETIVAVRT
ncbi:MAG: glycosyltransferase, partial [Rhizobiales bacterium]|nr:glycosyltransferase [Hyphomicrobiales bacterium]